MTTTAFHRLEVEGFSQELRVLRWRGWARLHACFELFVLAVPTAGGDTPLLGSSATLHLSVEAGQHSLAGVVDRVRATSSGLELVLVPPVARLGACTAHRVELDVDGLSLAEKVLADHGLEVDTRCPNPPQPRMQRVQAFEKDLAFAARLLAEEGICWFADQTGQGETKVVFAEGPSSFAPIEGDPALPYRSEAGMEASEAITEVKLSHRWATQRMEVRDYAFDKPQVDLTADAGDGAMGAYRFVGPGWYADAASGKALAQRLLEVEQREAVILEAKSTCHRLWPGRTFDLFDAPRDDLNRTWLVVEARLEGRETHAGDEPSFEAQILAIPADVPWRPNVVAAPSMGGVQTAMITGPGGEEIHTDEHGRVRAKLRYDVGKPADDKASAWTRVLHPPTSGGFFLPRTGWEALVAFSRDSGDEPYVLGRLDNGGMPTAESLPGKQVCSNFGTPTTPSGGSANMFRMTDTAGSEDMSLTASRDWKEQTKANKSFAVKGSVDWTIGANHDLSCEANRGLKVGASLAVSVGGNRSLSAGEGIVVEAGAEVISVGGTRDFAVGGDQITKVGGALSRAVGGAKVTVPIASNNRHVDAASSMVVGGAWMETGATASVSVAGLSSLTCSATAIKAAKYSLGATALVETCGARVESAANISLSSDGALALTFAATSINAPTVVVKGSSITVAAGGGVLSVSPGSVKFTGVLKAGGHVRSAGNAKHG